MLKFNKHEFQELCRNKYPDLKTQDAVEKIRKNYANHELGCDIVVLNPRNSQKKKYLVSTGFLDRLSN